ncbi:hypothetical protein [Kribbella sp. NPDC048915]|uniref:hypothetical protein n=1 Tax=Kribbella sp. NPDC048915 TaxID=3155148 RepID=UPI0033C0B99A
MNLPGKRLILGSVVAAAALGVGGVAYAVGNDPAPQQGYVRVDDGATTPSPAAPSEQSRADCPEKNGGGQSGTEQNPAGNA